jgi:uncharacterized membrane protein YfcA
MIHAHDLALTALAFFSETLGTISGFGSSTFFVPGATFFETFHFVLALSALLHCLGNISKLALFSGHFQWSAFFKLAIPSILLSGIGALLTGYVRAELLTKCLGVLLLVVPFFLVFGGKFLSRMPAPVLSGISGFSTGLLGTGGAIRGIALASLHLEKNSFVSISAAIDIGGDILRAAIYLRNGYMDWQQWFYIPLLGLAALLGSWVGKLILSRISQELFERVVAGFVFISGLSMLII